MFKQIKKTIDINTALVTTDEKTYDLLVDLINLGDLRDKGSISNEEFREQAVPLTRKIKRRRRKMKLRIAGLTAITVTAVVVLIVLL